MVCFGIVIGDYASRSVVEQLNVVIILKKLLVLFGLIVQMPLSAHASDLCKAIALRDIPALQSSTSILKSGNFDTAITLYRVNKKTGEGSFCSHGGYCYPTHVQVDGRQVEALRLVNCRIGKKQEDNDHDEINFAVDLDRSKIGPDMLKSSDVSDKLVDLGLCQACADNAAHAYVTGPQSPCGRLVKGAINGRADAIKILISQPTYCDSDVTSSKPPVPTNVEKGKALSEKSARDKAIQILLGDPYGKSAKEVDDKIKEDFLAGPGTRSACAQQSGSSWAFHVIVSKEQNPNGGDRIDGYLCLDAKSGKMISASLPFLD